MNRRDALQDFLSEVIPTFRDKGAWEDLAWNVIGVLTEEQLRQLKADFDGDLMIMSTDEWVTE